MANKGGEGAAYSHLCDAFCGFSEFKKAMHFHKLGLGEISKEMRSRAGEGAAYSNLGNDYSSLGDFEEAI